jgi:nucleolar protein 9
LYLLKRNPEEWRNVQSQRKSESIQGRRIPASEQTPHAVTSEPQKRKRESRPLDEIDALFEASLGKRVKKGSLAVEGADARLQSAQEATTEGVKDGTLLAVLGAIRAAPDDKGRRKKSRVV